MTDYYKYAYCVTPYRVQQHMREFCEHNKVARIYKYTARIYRKIEVHGLYELRKYQ